MKGHLNVNSVIIPDITKTQSNNCFIILYLQVITQFLAGSMSELRSHSYFAVRELDIAVRALDIALGNHALRAATYRLYTNLWVQISKKSVGCAVSQN